MLDQLIRELKQNTLPSDAEALRQFESTLARIVALEDSRCIPPLMQLFHDGMPNRELMYSIIHTIEVFEDKQYVDGIVKGLRAMTQNAPMWANVLHMRILNSPATTAAYQERLHSADEEEKMIVRQVLQSLASEEQDFASQCDVLLQLTN